MQKSAKSNSLVVLVQLCLVLVIFRWLPLWVVIESASILINYVATLLKSGSCYLDLKQSMMIVFSVWYILEGYKQISELSKL